MIESAALTATREELPCNNGGGGGGGNDDGVEVVGEGNSDASGVWMVSTGTPLLDPEHK